MPGAGFRDQWSGVTLPLALRLAVERWGQDNPAYVFHQTSLTLGQVQADAASVREALAAADIGAGDRVAVVMTGLAAWPGVFYGVTATGAVVVPLNTRLPGKELANLVHRVGARALVHHSGSGELVESRVESMLSETAHERVAGSLSGSPALTDLRIDVLRTISAGRREVDDGDALIIFTSGSSGVPKAALLNHEGVLRGGYYVNRALEVGPSDVFFSPQPFFHAGGALQVINAPLTTGCTVVVQDRFEADGALRTIHEHSCTVTLGHQPHWVDYLEHPRARELMRSVRRAFVIGETPIRKRIEDELGVATVSPYGMTETHIAGTCTHISDDRVLRTESHGRAYPGVDLRVVDPLTGQRLRAGETGEICIGGWPVSRGYLGDDGTVTASAGDLGLMHTGDLGRLDANGTLFRLGRIKDVIRVGGENVGAAEIERVLFASEYVKQARVIAWPDERLGEVPVAVVAVNDAAAALNDLHEVCAVGLARFQVPRLFVFTSQLPMGATGKIDSAGIRKMVKLGYADPNRFVAGDIALGSSFVPMVVSTILMDTEVVDPKATSRQGGVHQ